MPRNAAGVYSLPDPPRVPNTTIDSPDENITRDDIGAELTNSLDRNGRGGMLAPFRIADGTVAAPGLGFLNDPDNGLYRIGVDDWAIACQGQKMMEFTPGAVSIPAGINLALGSHIVMGGDLTVTPGHVWISDGSVALPGLAFASDHTTGIFKGGASVLTIGAGSVALMNFAPSVITLLQNTVITANATLALSGANGQVLLSPTAVPALAFVTQPTLGFFFEAAGVIGCTGAIRFTAVNIGAAGTSWVGQSGGGLFLNTATGNQIRLAINNTDIAMVEATGLIMAGAGKFYASDATPGYAFNLDTDTGFRRTASGEVRYVCNGVDTVQFTGPGGGGILLSFGGSGANTLISNNAGTFILQAASSHMEYNVAGAALHRHFTGGGERQRISSSEITNYTGNQYIQAAQAVLYFVKTVGASQIWRLQTDAQSTDDIGIFNHTAGHTVFSINNVGGGEYEYKCTRVKTTASAANAFLDSGNANNLMRSTSSLKMKDEIKPMTLAEAHNVAFGRNGFSYKSNASGDDPNLRWIGYGAEEVAKSDPRFVTLDQHKQPDWVQYERFVVPHGIILEDHEARIAALEGKP